MDRLDTTKILNVDEHLNKINWDNYLDEKDKQWVRYINYPISQAELDRICELSQSPKSKIKLINSMGDLYKN